MGLGAAGTAILGAGALGAAGSVASGIIGSNAAKSAASTQAGAADYAANLQLQEFSQIRKSLEPFIKGGTGAFNELRDLTGGGKGGPGPLNSFLTRPWQPNMNQLEQTPGYQFTLKQGELATQNSYAAQGLGSSGAAAKGAAGYAEGLASTTYQQQFQNYLAQKQQIYNMLSGESSLGANAAANSGQLGMQAASNAGSLTTAGAAASAAGTIGSANALGGAISGVSGSAGNTALMLALQNGGFFGNSTANTGG